MNKVEDFLRRTFISPSSDAGDSKTSNEDVNGNGAESSIRTPLDAGQHFTEAAHQAIKTYQERLLRIDAAVSQLVSALEEGSKGLHGLVAVAGQSSMAAMATTPSPTVPNQKVSKQNSLRHNRTASLLLTGSTSGHVASSGGIPPELSVSLEDHPAVSGHQRLQTLLKDLDEGLGRIKGKCVPAFRKEMSEQCCQPLTNLQLSLEDVDDLRRQRSEALGEVIGLVEKGKQQLLKVQQAAAGEGSTSHLMSHTLPRQLSQSSMDLSTIMSSPSGHTHFFDHNGTWADIKFVAAGLSVVERQRLERARQRLTNLEAQYEESLSKARENELFTTAATSQSFLYAISGVLGAVAVKLQSVLETTLPPSGQLLLPGLENAFYVANTNGYSNAPNGTLVSNKTGDQMLREYNFATVNNLSPKSYLSGESSVLLYGTNRPSLAQIYKSGGGGSVNTPTAEGRTQSKNNRKVESVASKVGSTNSSGESNRTNTITTSEQSARPSLSTRSHATGSDEQLLPPLSGKVNQQQSPNGINNPTLIGSSTQSSNPQILPHFQQNQQQQQLPQHNSSRVVRMPVQSSNNMSLLKGIGGASSSQSLSATMTTVAPTTITSPSPISQSISPANSFHANTPRGVRAPSASIMLIRPLWAHPLMNQSVPMPKREEGRCNAATDGGTRDQKTPLARVDPKGVYGAITPSSLKDETPKGWDGPHEAFGTMLRGGGGYGYGATHGHTLPNGVAIFAPMAVVGRTYSAAEQDGASINQSTTATDYPTTTYGGSVRASVEHGTLTSNSFVSTAREFLGATPMSLAQD